MTYLLKSVPYKSITEMPNFRNFLMDFNTLSKPNYKFCVGIALCSVHNNNNNNEEEEKKKS
jgi:hypothetical protein